MHDGSRWKSPANVFSEQIQLKYNIIQKTQLMPIIGKRKYFLCSREWSVFFLCLYSLHFDYTYNNKYTNTMDNTFISVQEQRKMTSILTEKCLLTKALAESEDLSSSCES